MDGTIKTRSYIARAARWEDDMYAVHVIQQLAEGTLYYLNKDLSELVLADLDGEETRQRRADLKDKMRRLKAAFNEDHNSLYDAAMLMMELAGKRMAYFRMQVLAVALACGLDAQREFCNLEFAKKKFDATIFTRHAPRHAYHEIKRRLKFTNVNAMTRNDIATFWSEVCVGCVCPTDRAAVAGRTIVAERARRWRAKCAKWQRYFALV
uniref:ORF24 n=1 Tax=Lymantria dispar multicapsid nuclear polyhedrosis virus TaxID=10449 RepID=A0A513WW74_NPVLD|nr:ORF24 [Lymantria dispar multiple nucleopolyhedrovirus]